MRDEKSAPSAAAAPRAPRSAGPLSISEAMRALVRRCAANGERIAEQPALSLASVQRIEEELGCSLPDDVLAVIAAGSWMLSTATNLQLESVLEYDDEEWSEGVPHGFLGIALVYSEPFAEKLEGAHGGPYDLIAIPRRGPVDRTDIVVVTDGHPAERTTLAAFASDKIDAWYRGRSDGSSSPTVAVERFAPQLVGPALSAPASSERWVTHKKLGRGRLLEMRDDKWIVAFDNGTKTIKRDMFLEGAAVPAPVAEAPNASVQSAAEPDHPLWPTFAGELRKAGVDPRRGFFEQADASKGNLAYGHDYRCRDADARVRTTLRAIKAMMGVTLGAHATYESSESETWTSPEECFRAAADRAKPSTGGSPPA